MCRHTFFLLDDLRQPLSLGRRRTSDRCFILRTRLIDLSLLCDNDFLAFHNARALPLDLSLACFELKLKLADASPRQEVLIFEIIEASLEFCEITQKSCCNYVRHATRREN